LTGGNGGLPTGSCTVVRFDHLCCQLPIYYAARSGENDASFTSFFRTVYVHIFKRNEDYTQTIHNLKDEKTKVRANGLCIACSPGLSATSQQYFSLRTNQPPATSRNQPAVLFSQNKPAPAIIHQPTEQAVNLKMLIFCKKK
jgi:hypothetical protein